MNDWSSFGTVLDEHRKAYEKILTNYPPAQDIDCETLGRLQDHLDAIVRCCDQIYSWATTPRV